MGQDRGDPLSDAELSELERLSYKASPAPWVASVEGRDHMSGDDVILVEASCGKRTCNPDGARGRRAATMRFSGKGVVCCGQRVRHARERSAELRRPRLLLDRLGHLAETALRREEDPEE